MKQGQSLVILSPTRGSVSDAQADTLMRLAIACAAQGIALARTPREIPGLLEHARNTLCGEVLNDPDKPSHYLWLDSDVHFHPSLVLESLSRPEALIARAYPQRQPNWGRLAEHVSNGVRGEEAIKHAGYQYGVGLVFRNGKPAWSEDGKLVEVRQLGFGWVLIKGEPFRAFLEYLSKTSERVAAEFMNATDRLSSADAERELAKLLARHQRMDSVDFGLRRTIHAFAHCAIDGIDIDGGEDTSFYYRWRTWGQAGPIWLDPWQTVGNGDRTGAYIEYMRQVFGPSRSDLGLPAIVTEPAHEAATLPAPPP
jgi:hypothetical protein